MSRATRTGVAVDLPDGYTLRQTASGHYTVLSPGGDVLRMPNGVPVVLSFSPSDGRTRRNERARLRRALHHHMGAS